MLFELIKQPLVMMFVCAIGVFGIMYGAKHSFLWLTKKIKTERYRKVANMVLGVATCLEVAFGLMWVLCDACGIAYLWQFAIGSAFIANYVYIVLEKYFGADVEAIGKIVKDIFTHSDLFDGTITAQGVAHFVEKTTNMLKQSDEKVASKETKAIDEVVAKFDAFLADGKVTEEEKAEAKALAHGIDDATLLAKYSNLLK
jgi:cytochrome c556